MKMREGSAEPSKIIVDANKGGVFVNPCPKCLKLRFQLEELERLKVVAERDKMRVVLRQLYSPNTPVFSTRFKVAAIPADKVAVDESVSGVPSAPPNDPPETATQPDVPKASEGAGDSRVSGENSPPTNSPSNDMPSDKPPGIHGDATDSSGTSAAASSSHLLPPPTKDLTLEFIGMDNQKVLVRVNGELIRFAQDLVTTHENGSVKLKRFKHLSVNLVRCVSH